MKDWQPQALVYTRFYPYVSIAGVFMREELFHPGLLEQREAHRPEEEERNPGKKAKKGEKKEPGGH